MYSPKDNVTPVPEDELKMEAYIQDRRVIGVRDHLLSLLHCASYLSPCPLRRLPTQYDPLLQPALLRHEVVSSQRSLNTIASARFAAARILAGHDDRLVVVVGPCSIHSPQQAIEYAELLKSKMPEWNNLLIIMRAYLYVPMSAIPVSQ